MSHESFWKESNVLVTGGASFIGSHIVDKLVAYGANVTVLDDLSSGRLENLTQSLGQVKFVTHNLEYNAKDVLKTLFKDQDHVFHMAAIHGGRGFIDTHPADVCSNLALDHHVFQACSDSNVDKIVFASTACVYPTKLQGEVGSDYKLKEIDCDTSNLEEKLSADMEYGWAKLMSEIQLKAFHKQYGLNCCPLRFVTAYGPRENETHAIIALIYKAVEKMDPYPIWGDGNQERDFTYVEDIVDGCLLAAEKPVNDGTPINLGTGTRYKIKEVVEMICKVLNWRPKEFIFEKDKPVGVLSRALDNSDAKELLGWEPKFSLKDGLTKTIEWYLKTHKISGKINDDILLEHNSTT